MIWLRFKRVRIIAYMWLVAGVIAVLKRENIKDVHARGKRKGRWMWLNR